ncbi:MAG: phosphonates-binding protein [Bdellovibrionales bacterium GWA2_49_15]|nr:MAG: phosphonates-binding protein [Bdellovibrionales bacterium GWA2_49_15]HAZ15014.1 phosphate/phosphite/phosphonate ABC transporter substrate-binding protein [Bdellovibrionales bacterium]
MFKLTVLLLGLMLVFGCQKQDELGSRNNPIKLYFTPSVDATIIASNSQEFLKYIEKETGLFFETGIPTNYIAVVEAFGSERADIAVMNSFGYLMANEKYGAHAKLTVLRYGENFYRGQIIANTKSNIKEVKDLQGKKFAFTDPSSTSGYMFPLKILKENKVETESTVFAQKHDNVVTMVYQGQVDAGATFYSPPAEDGTIRDARARVQTQFPDVEDKVKIVALTEKIPNDPFVFRKGLPDAIVEKFITALKKFLSTESGQKVFKNIYSVDSIVDSTDADYDGLRAMVKAINLNKEELVK